MVLAAYRKSWSARGLALQSQRHNRDHGEGDDHNAPAHVPQVARRRMHQHLSLIHIFSLKACATGISGQHEGQRSKSEEPVYIPAPRSVSTLPRLALATCGEVGIDTGRPAGLPCPVMFMWWVRWGVVFALLWGSAAWAGPVGTGSLPPAKAEPLLPIVAGQFVSTIGTQFMLGGQPFRFVGANVNPCLLYTSRCV